MEKTALFTVLVIHWATSRDNAEAIGFPCSSPSFTSRDKHCSCHPPAPLPTSAQRRGQKPAISRPLNTTSTSQYEHIFGDLEPETETEVVTASNISATASKTIPESSDGIDDENAPTTDLGLEEENEIMGMRQQEFGLALAHSLTWEWERRESPKPRPRRTLHLPGSHATPRSREPWPWI